MQVTMLLLSLPMLPPGASSMLAVSTSVLVVEAAAMRRHTAARRHAASRGAG